MEYTIVPEFRVLKVMQGYIPNRSNTKTPETLRKALKTLKPTVHVKATLNP